MSTLSRFMPSLTLVYSHFYLVLICLIYCFRINAQCNFVQPNLGNDTVFCETVNATLYPGIYDYYKWDNNSTSPFRIINSPGIYSVMVGTVDHQTNLVINGDFEMGNSGFTTQYNYTTTVTSYGNILGLGGYYSITSSPNSLHLGFSNCTDLTSNPGSKMMAVNGAADNNKKVWCQNITVEPNTDYVFSANASSVLSPQYATNPALLNFTINNTIIGTTSNLTNQPCQWVPFNQTWNSGMITSAQVCIINQNTIAEGNDFLLDEISFNKICYQYDTISVTIAPSITINGLTDICMGDSITLEALPVNANETITWLPMNVVSNTITVSPNQDQIYTVTVENQFGCIKTDHHSVHVLEIPYINPEIQIDTSNYCEGDTIILSILNPNTDLHYLWNDLDEGHHYTVVADEHSTIELSAIGINGCTSNIIEIPLTIEPNPVFQIQSSQMLACEGEVITLSVQSSEAINNINWSPVLSTTSVLVDTIFQTTTYFVSASNVMGCSSTDSVVIEVINLQIEIINNDSIVCLGDSVTIQASSNFPTTNFSWNNGDTTMYTTIVPNQSQYIYLVGENTPCASKMDSVFLTVIPKPIVVAPENQVICSGEEVDLEASATPSTSMLFIYSVDNPTTLLDLYPTESNTYEVYAIHEGCSSEIVTFQILVDGICSEIIIPNIFSPNNDGTNDFFQLDGVKAVKEFHCIILNRWGQVIQEFTDTNFAWNGKNKLAQDVPDGVYFYKMNFVMQNDTKESKEGFITVTR